MANTQAPFGFRPIKTGGVPYSGAFSTLKAQFNAAALNRGDMVTQLADGSVKVYVAGDGHLARGVYIGCHYLSAALGYPLWSNYWPGSGGPASGLIDVFVIDDPSVTFEVAALLGPKAPPETAAIVADTLRATNPRGFMQAVKLSLSDFYGPDVASKFTFPVLLIHGSEDRVNPLEKNAAILIKALPQGLS